MKKGGRFLQLWIGIILHGLVVETVSYNLPDVDNFWHAQAPIMFLGRRLPLYVILLCMLKSSRMQDDNFDESKCIKVPSIYVFADAVFIYTSAIAVDKLNLPRWSEPFAVGLTVVLIDYPYDVIGIRFLYWTWHDTDPNIFDRHYHVPWNSFYFHATFAASFIFWFHFTRYLTSRHTKKWISDGS